MSVLERLNAILRDPASATQEEIATLARIASDAVWVANVGIVGAPGSPEVEAALRVRSGLLRLERRKPELGEER